MSARLYNIGEWIKEGISGKADSTHNHSVSDVTDLQSSLDGKAPISHNHPISNVTGLQSALDGKQASGNYITTETDPTVPGWAKSPNKPTYSTSEISGLQSALNEKASSAHDHTISEVTGLQASLDGKQDSGDYLTSETDPTVPEWAKASEKPSYSTSEISGLQSALDSKATTGHIHKLQNAQITGILPIAKGGTGANDRNGAAISLFSGQMLSDENIIDANDVVWTGAYMVAGVTGNNYPCTYGILVVISGGTYIMQVCQDNSDGTLYSRKRNDSGIWSEWKTITQS